MKTKIQLLCIVMVFSFISINAQIKKSYTTKLPSTTKKTTYKVPSNNSKTKTALDNNAKMQANTKALLRSGIIKFEPVTQTFPGGKSVLKKVDNNFGIPSFNKKPVGTSKEGAMNCVTNRLTINSPSKSIGAFGSVNDADWLLPGLIMKSKNVLNGSFKIEDVGDMNPFIVMNTKSGKSEKVVSPHKKSSLALAVKNVKRQLGKNDLHTVFHGTYTEVTSLEEISFKIEGKYSLSVPAVVNVDIASSAKSTTRNEKYYYLIKFEQKLFSVEVQDYEMLDVKNSIFKGNVNPSNLVYVSSVNYGRRAIVIVSSTKKFASGELNIKASFETITQDGELEINGKTLKEGSEINIEAFFYGGDTNAALTDFYKTAQSKKIDIKTYLTRNATNVYQALPINYTLKNFNGDVVGIVSNLSQNVKTCVPAYNESSLKLTIELESFYNDKAGDSDKKDDYAFNQAVLLKIGNNYLKGKSVRSLYNNFIPSPDRRPHFISNSKANILMTGDKDHQFWSLDGNFENNNIGKKGDRYYREFKHYVTFELSPKQLSLIKAGDYSFDIYNYLREYSSNVTYMSGIKKVNVDLDKVIKNLQTITALPNKSGANNGWINYVKTGPSFKLRKYRTDDDSIYGYIRFSKDDRKAKAKMRFKLIE